MTSDYRFQFTLSTLSPDGDIGDEQIHALIMLALHKVASDLNSEILWHDFTNLTEQGWD